MKHDYINDNQIVDRYLMDKLPPDETDEFEQHYLHCTRCQDELALSQKLRQGLGQISGNSTAVGEQTADSARWARYMRISPGPRFAAAAALLLAGALSLNLITWRLLADSRHRQSELTDQLQAAHSPQSNTPILALTPVRSGGLPDGMFERRLTLGEHPGWVVVTMQLPLPIVGLQRYRAALRDAEATALWRADDLAANGNDEVVIMLHSSLLTPGNYSLQIEVLMSDDSWSTVGNYGFSVNPP